MMPFRFSEKSKAMMMGVHPDLIAIAYRALALSPYDFGITEGRRSLERQRLLVQEGKSQTLASRHLEGRALDFAVWIEGRITWEFRYYAQVAEAFKIAAREYGIDIQWGGDWKRFKDGPHVELV